MWQQTAWRRDVTTFASGQHSMACGSGRQLLSGRCWFGGMEAAWLTFIPARKGGFTNSWLHSSVKHTLYEQEDFPFMGRELKGGKNWRKNKLKPRIINYNCDETSKTLRPSGRIGHRRTGTCATTPRHGHWFNRGEIEKLPGFLLHESIKECTHDL